MSTYVQPLPRRLAAESLGSFLLAATVVGSGIMAERTFSGIRPADVPAFVGAQLAGALAALAVARVLFQSEKTVEDAFNPERVRQHSAK